jgi:hypothetical protein
MPNYNQPHQFYAGVDLHATGLDLVRLFGAAQSLTPLALWERGWE